MKKFLKVTGTILGIILLFVVTLALLTPWMDRWGATEEEISMTLPGDELVPEPASFVNRAIPIQASPEQIYPWLVQIGAEKGGFIGNRRDSPEHLAVKRKAKLISPYIWRSVTANPKEPKAGIVTPGWRGRSSAPSQTPTASTPNGRI